MKKIYTSLRQNIKEINAFTFYFKPKPFKFIQRKLNILEEWTMFKHNLRPHKLKIILTASLITYPLYKPIILYYKPIYYPYYS